MCIPLEFTKICMHACQSCTRPHLQVRLHGRPTQLHDVVQKGLGGVARHVDQFLEGVAFQNGFDAVFVQSGSRGVHDGHHVAAAIDRRRVRHAIGRGIGGYWSFNSATGRRIDSFCRFAIGCSIGGYGSFNSAIGRGIGSCVIGCSIGGYGSFNCAGYTPENVLEPFLRFADEEFSVCDFVDFGIDSCVVNGVGTDLHTDHLVHPETNGRAMGMVEGCVGAC